MTSDDQITQQGQIKLYTSYFKSIHTIWHHLKLDLVSFLLLLNLTYAEFIYYQYQLYNINFSYYNCNIY